MHNPNDLYIEKGQYNLYSCRNLGAVRGVQQQTGHLQAKQTSQSPRTRPWCWKRSALRAVIYQIRRNKRQFSYRCLAASTLQRVAALSRMVLVLSCAPAPVPAPHLLPDTFGMKKKTKLLLSFINRQKGLCHCSSVFAVIALSRDISNKISNQAKHL